MCGYRLYLNGSLRWTPAHTFRLEMFKDLWNGNPWLPSHQEPAQKVQDADYTLYLKRDFFDRKSQEVKYEAANLDALLLNATVGSLAEAWSGNGKD